MTAQDYVKLLTDRYDTVNELSVQLISLTKGEINNLYLKKNDLFGELVDLQYSHGFDHNDTKAKRIEMDLISEKIKAEESRNGMLFVQKQLEVLENEIEGIKANAREELDDYAYFSNAAICGSTASADFLSRNGFRVMTPYVHGDQFTVYVLRGNFDFQNGHIFLENMVKHLTSNSAYQGKPSIEIGLWHSDEDYYMTYCDGVWIVRIDEDIVFEDSDCQNILEYLNFIR
jgi:hypothetical protein